MQRTVENIGALTVRGLGGEGEPELEFLARNAVGALVGKRVEKWLKKNKVSQEGTFCTWSIEIEVSIMRHEFRKNQ